MVENEQQNEQQKVLIVEDEPSWFRINTKECEKLGAIVVGTENVDEAIEALKEGGFTHVISDGLKGEWRTIVRAAKEAGVKNITVLSAGDIQKVVEAENVQYVSKLDVGSRKIKHENLLR